MEFSLSSEQKMLIESARAFAENELYPHEEEVEQSDSVSRSSTWSAGQVIFFKPA